MATKTDEKAAKAAGASKDEAFAKLAVETLRALVAARGQDGKTAQIVATAIATVDEVEAKG